MWSRCDVSSVSDTIINRTRTVIQSFVYTRVYWVNTKMKVLHAKDFMISRLERGYYGCDYKSHLNGD